MARISSMVVTAFFLLGLQVSVARAQESTAGMEKSMLAR